ncbi:LPXTG cell wall anchor domain-containing protein [Listeria seeligeri]|uniref:LPXTG cell wall anchor domain-containing protein n=1 Tax=Listeria seeligeri TaxID=1640 RepID=UPI001E29B11D|nr:LPXTG cell wall anchor domain-containing protein [Listeria seeligeri]
MKKLILFSLCCLMIFVNPLMTRAYTDDAVSQAGIIFKQKDGTKKDGTDDRTGTFPSKAPANRLPKTGDTTDPFLVLLGCTFLLVAKKSYFKEVRKGN